MGRFEEILDMEERKSFTLLLDRPISENVFQVNCTYNVDGHVKLEALYKPNVNILRCIPHTPEKKPEDLKIGKA
jgi:hypothetical protein